MDLYLSWKVWEDLASHLFGEGESVKDIKINRRMRTGKVRSCLVEWFDDSSSCVAVCPTLAPIPHLIVRISLIITSCRKPPLHDLAAAAVNRPAAVGG